MAPAMGSSDAAKTRHLIVYGASGDMEISGQIITGGSTCGGGCDAVFSASYMLPSIAEHAEQMWAQGYLPAVGPTAENEPFNLTEKTGGMLNELEKAHIYIQQLHRRQRELEWDMTNLKAVGQEIAELRAVVARLLSEAATD